LELTAAEDSRSCALFSRRGAYRQQRQRRRPERSHHR